MIEGILDFGGEEKRASAAEEAASQPYSTLEYTRVQYKVVAGIMDSVPVLPPQSRRATPSL